MRDTATLIRISAMTCLALWATHAAASVQEDGLVSRDEALESVYPGAGIEAERLFLTTGQVEQISALAGTPLASPLVARYLARRDGEIVGRAYVETHVVRTKRESLLVSLDREGRVQRIDVTAFLEPPEYLAARRWREQFEGDGLSDDLQVHRRIRSIAGATLTAQAATDAVRRVLAIDQVVERAGPQEEPR